MKRNRIAYSDILIKFIEPLLDGTEDADDFMMKARMGMVAWNGRKPNCRLSHP